MWFWYDFSVKEIVPLAANVFQMSRSHNDHLPILSLCITINLGQTSVKVVATLQLLFSFAHLDTPCHRSVAFPPWRQVLTLWFLGSIFVEVNNQTLKWNKNSEAVQTDWVSKLVGHPFSVIRKRLDHELYIKLSQELLLQIFFSGRSYAPEISHRSQTLAIFKGSYIPFPRPIILGPSVRIF